MKFSLNSDNFKIRKFLRDDLEKVIKIIHLNLEKINSGKYPPQIINFMKEYYGFANFANVLNDLNELWVLIKDNKDKKGNRDNKGNNNEKLIGVCGWACPKKEEFLKILKYLNSIHHISPDISFTKSNFAFIKTMFILPKYHNRGLGKFLLKFIENRLIIQNIKYALLKSSLNAITFYQNNKYFLLEKIRDNDYGDTILMFKNLNLERKQ